MLKDYNSKKPIDTTKTLVQSSVINNQIKINHEIAEILMQFGTFPLPSRLKDERNPDLVMMFIYEP